ncbi:hypothetical protein Ancab_027459 [Ancistrocladus abbreviatus]
MCITSLKEGLLSHARALKSGIGLTIFTSNQLIRMFAQNGLIHEARQVFEEMPERNVFTWNTIIAAHVKNNDLEQAEALFNSSHHRDLVTFNSMLAGYVDVDGYEIDALKLFVEMQASDTGIDENRAKYLMVDNGNWTWSPRMQWLRHVVEKLNDTVSWSTIISGFEQNGHYEESLKLFVSMSLKLGKEVHARLLKEGLHTNQYVSSGIVDIYCKCGNMEYAEIANAAFGVENTFSVTSMILGYSSIGYVKSQQCEVVFVLLKELLAEKIFALDPVILIHVLGACTIQASLDPGKQVHSYVLRKGIQMDEKLISAMIDMYSKCGNITYAERIFKEFMNRDSVLYNVMIAGYAHHGHEDRAVNLFTEMLGRGCRPNTATFIALLSACRHSGSVELGEQLFNSMATNYGIAPEVDHYACVIDLYGRANQLEKALSFMRKIPIEPDAVIWGAFFKCLQSKWEYGTSRRSRRESAEDRRRQWSSICAIGKFVCWGGELG